MGGNIAYLTNQREIVISIAFNTFKFTEARLTPKWIDERLDIFWAYTLQSIKAQTNQDFEVFLNYDPLSEQYIQAALKKRGKLPSNVHFGTESYNKQSMNEMMQSKDYLFLVRLDSDDMYEKHFIERLHQLAVKEGTEALINTDGYLYSVISGKLSNYHHISPPFYVLIYQVEEFIDGKRYQLPGGHRDVQRVLKHDNLQGRNFMVTLRKMNTTSGEWMIQEKTGYEEKEKKVILGQFGIER